MVQNTWAETLLSKQSLQIPARPFILFVLFIPTLLIFALFILVFLILSYRIIFTVNP